MSTETHYRRQAALCRAEASLRYNDDETRQTWFQLAEEYEKQADRAAPPPPQQQANTDDEDNS
jgi:hypothetical protein